MITASNFNSALPDSEPRQPNGTAPAAQWRQPTFWNTGVCHRLGLDVIRIELSPGQRLFSRGDAARYAYVVEKGYLGISRSASHLSRRLATCGSGSLVLLDCDGQREFDCTALVASSVLAIDMSQVKRRAQRVDWLATALRQTHARELSLVLQSAPEFPVRTAGHSPRPARLREICRRRNCVEARA